MPRDQWIAVTTRGQSGSTLLAIRPENGNIYLDHSITDNTDTVPLSSTSLQIEKSFSITGNILPFVADDTNDRFYAIATGISDGQIIIDAI